MSFTPEGARINALITGSLGASTDDSFLFGCHVFMVTGGGDGNYYGIQSTSGQAGGFIGPARHDANHSYGTTQTTAGQTYSLDTWFPVLHYWGPVDGTSRPHIVWTNGTKDSDTDAIETFSETINDLIIGAEYRFANNTNTMGFGGSSDFSKIAEAFCIFGLSEAQADDVATDALTLLPSGFRSTPDHYWPLLNNGNASIGGLNLVGNGGTPVFDAGEHPSLSGGAPAPASRPIIINHYAT